MSLPKLSSRLSFLAVGGGETGKLFSFSSTQTELTHSQSVPTKTHFYIAFQTEHHQGVPAHCIRCTSWPHNNMSLKPYHHHNISFHLKICSIIKNIPKNGSNIRFGRVYGPTDLFNAPLDQLFHHASAHHSPAYHILEPRHFVLSRKHVRPVSLHWNHFQYRLYTDGSTF